MRGSPHAHVHPLRASPRMRAYAPHVRSCLDGMSARFLHAHSTKPCTCVSNQEHRLSRRFSTTLPSQRIHHFSCFPADCPHPLSTGCLSSSLLDCTWVLCKRSVPQNLKESSRAVEGRPGLQIFMGNLASCYKAPPTEGAKPVAVPKHPNSFACESNT